MNPIKAIKLAMLFSKAKSILKEGKPMNLKIGPLLTLFGSLSGTIGLPVMAADFVHSHPYLYMGLVAFAIILHTIMPSIFGGPSDADKKASGLGSVVPILFLILALGLMAPARVQAQSFTIPPVDGNNIGAVGLNYSVNASPSFAGSLLYARQALPASGTWVFANGDFLPNTLKPFTVTNNIGTGVAQKVADFGTTPIFCITGAGVSWTGTNTGYQFNGGCLAAFKVKNFLVMPSGRFLKSSVSNGTGYQPIIGVYVGKRF
jgi:hypothetical protein